MISSSDYKKAFFFAIALHLFLIGMLLTDSTTKRPVLTAETKNTPGLEQVTATQHEIVKAVAVDNKEIKETVNRLKQEREQQQKAELKRQEELNRQVQHAKQERIKEQQQLAKLKDEANKIAIARKKQVEEEKKHLKELAEQKIREAKRIEELKKQQEKLVEQQKIESKRLAELNNKKALEKAKADKLKAEQASVEKVHRDKMLAEKAAAAQAQANREQKMQAEAASAQNAERQARLAGEVDKYKALIVNAISRNWILPENVDSSLYCKFRIRLAPDGTVLEVALLRGSGDPLLDRSAQTAIRKASPLPVPTEAETFNSFRDISLTVRPEQVRG